MKNLEKKLKTINLDDPIGEYKRLSSIEDPDTFEMIYCRLLKLLINKFNIEWESLDRERKLIEEEKKNLEVERKRIQDKFISLNATIRDGKRTKR